MKLQIKSDNPNYVARVVKLENVRKHSNADRLQCVSILANNVITGLNAKDGDSYIYFPLECAINGEYLSWSNSFSKAEMNADTSVKGFFGKHGRVKAISLRGEKSEGYIVPLQDIVDWLNEVGNKCSVVDFEHDVDFDHIGDIKICEKYINPETLRKQQNAERNKNKKVKRESKIVPLQFRVAEDTKHLKREMDKLNLDDIITIGYKMHGCNMSLGKVLCKRKLGVLDKVCRFFGANIDENHYDLVYASRRVVKNEYADKETDSFYDFDVWELMAQKYKDALKDGVVLYGEVVGYGPTGGGIQGDYDYGQDKTSCEFYAYRGTIVNASGDVFEMTTPQLERYCKKMGIPMVPIFYYGTVRNWIEEYNRHNVENEIDVEDRAWRDRLLADWMDKYNEKDCYMCKSKVPEEGIVVIRESDHFEAFKLKSFRFLQRESDELDKGIENMEDSG